MKTERLLTLVPLSANCAIECNPSTRGTILELFLALQHPYIYPVLDLDFREVSGQTYVILVLPFNNKGSLKDLIYKVRPVSTWVCWDLCTWCAQSDLLHISTNHNGMFCVVMQWVDSTMQVRFSGSVQASRVAHEASYKMGVWSLPGESGKGVPALLKHSNLCHIRVRIICNIRREGVQDCITQVMWHRLCSGFHCCAIQN